MEFTYTHAYAHKHHYPHAQKCINTLDQKVEVKIK